MDPTSTHLRKGRSGASRVLIWRLLALALMAALAACGGGGGDSTSASGSPQSRSAAAGDDAQGGADGESTSLWSGLVGAIDGALNKIGIDIGAEPKATTTQLDAVRLANQATFGPNEALIAQIRQEGAALWIAGQMNLQRQAVKRVPGAADVVTTVALPKSRYTSGGTNAVHKHTSKTVDFCDNKGPTCWRDWSSSTPLVWDFYRNAVHSPDQLRLRVGLALQQMLVISNYEVSGTYGLRNYNNMLLDNAFGNYRDVLKKVILSPVMGDYLDHVNNDKAAPNENFARELLQLFSLGTCLLNADGSLQGGTCTPTYDNARVREYAFALTGWTYPAGGATPWGCYPSGSNCQFYDGDMVLKAGFHNTQPRTLLSGVTLANGNTADVALEKVLTSIMAHQNVAPFVSRHLIQQLVTSNPSPAYVQRVVTAFNTGRYTTFGSGVKGDLAATVAAVLLDTEARSTPTNTAGRLREPIQLFTAVLRALNGRTDGEALGWWWGEEMREHVFRPPSVFNFYPPDYPVAGTTPPLVGPAFGIHNANTALNRMNYLNYLIFWDGSGASSDVPNAVGTKVNLSAFASTTNAATLVDRLSLLALGEILPATSRTAVINAVNAYPSNTADGRTNRARQAAFLVFASPQFQMTR
ncbi:DUF1800 domain-containing protein [Hydrogenophaga sp. RWCD_12]|uniref:DUF1800 domain-containing protein n=1 Tax=Hydrogenophaga sp. RWCD_12 TaxID=3391190 RepID=UPI0039852EC9